MKLYNRRGVSVSFGIITLRWYVPYNAGASALTALSFFMTLHPSKSLLLVFIEGLKLPNKPSTPYELRYHGGVAWFC